MISAADISIPEGSFTNIFFLESINLFSLLLCGGCETSPCTSLRIGSFITIPQFPVNRIENKSNKHRSHDQSPWVVVFDVTTRKKKDGTKKRDQCLITQEMPLSFMELNDFW